MHMLKLKPYERVIQLRETMLKKKNLNKIKKREREKST